jgi:hypothetical protein
VLHEWPIRLPILHPALAPSNDFPGETGFFDSLIVNLIASTTTKAGLTVKARLDTNRYQRGIKVSAEELARIALEPHEFHGEWNYTIRPN